MADTEKETHSRLRGNLALLLAGGWIVGWWIRLDDMKHAALAACGVGGDFFKDIGAGVCRSTAGSRMVGGLLLVLFTAPLAIVVAHYVAKLVVARQVADEERARRAQEEQRRTVYEAEIREMGTRAERETVTAQASNDRHEIITRLGVVDDQLILIDGEKDDANIKRITINLTQALREIHAKFTLATLGEMYAADAGLRQHVERTLEEMDRIGLGGSRQHKDLAGMFGVELASATPVADASAA